MEAIATRLEAVTTRKKKLLDATSSYLLYYIVGTLNLETQTTMTQNKTIGCSNMAIEILLADVVPFFEGVLWCLPLFGEVCWDQEPESDATIGHL